MPSNTYATWGVTALVVALYYAILRLIVFLRYPRAGAISVHSTPPRGLPPSLLGFISEKESPVSMINTYPLEVDMLWLAIKGLLRIRICFSSDNHIYAVFHKEDKAPDASDPACAYQCELLQKLFPDERKTLDILAESDILSDADGWVYRHYREKTRRMWARHRGFYFIMAILTMAFCEMATGHAETSFITALLTVFFVIACALLAISCILIAGMTLFFIFFPSWPSWVKFFLFIAMAGLVGWATHGLIAIQPTLFDRNTQIFLDEIFTFHSFFSAVCAAVILVIAWFPFFFQSVYRTDEARKLVDEAEGFAQYIGLKEKRPYGSARTPEEKLGEAEALFPYAASLCMDWELGLDPELSKMEYSPAFLEGCIPEKGAPEKTIDHILPNLLHILVETVFYSTSKVWPYYKAHWPSYGP